MTAERVIITRTEMARVRALVTEALEIVEAILQRPEPHPPETDDRGWPVLGGPEEQP